MNRRHFIGGALAGVSGLFAGSCARKQPSPEAQELFSFIHFTDVHVQPERGGREGFLAAIEKMNSLGADFAVSGGDLVMDALEADEMRAFMLYDMYADCCTRFDMPVHQVMGNHEVFGIYVPEKVPLDHPDWGKELFKKRLGNGATYRSFDHKGVHFIVLDSVGIEQDENGPAYHYIGQIGIDQLMWLKNDMATLAPGTPVIAVAHIPLFSLYEQIQRGPTAPWGRSGVLTDGKELFNLFSGCTFFGLLEGHIHVNELYRYKEAHYIDTAAVCGAWWAGPRDGHPEGFNLVHVYQDGIIAEYVTYGWDASRFPA